MNKLLIALSSIFAFFHSFAGNNEFTVFTGQSFALQHLRYEHRFVPYVYDPEGIGKQSIVFDSANNPVVGLAYTRWLNNHWGVQGMYQFQRQSYSGQSNVYVHFEWEQWQAFGEWPILEREEMIEPPVQPEFAFDQHELQLNALYRRNLGRLQLLLNTGFLFSQLSDIKLNQVYVINWFQASRGSLLSSRATVDLDYGNLQQYGLNFGVGLDVNLYKNLELYLRARYMHLFSRQMVGEMASYDDSYTPWTMGGNESLQARLKNSPFKMNQKSIQIELGLTLAY